MDTDKAARNLNTAHARIIADRAAGITEATPPPALHWRETAYGGYAADLPDDGGMVVIRPPLPGSDEFTANGPRRNGMTPTWRHGSSDTIKAAVARHYGYAAG